MKVTSFEVGTAAAAPEIVKLSNCLSPDEPVPIKVNSPVALANLSLLKSPAA